MAVHQKARSQQGLAFRREDRPLRVALLGGFGGGNIGNDASLAAGIRIAEQLDREVVLTAVCPRPEAVRERFGIAAQAIHIRPARKGIFASPLGRLVRSPYRLFDVYRAFRTMGDVDALIVPGTGILDDYGSEPPWGWPLTLAVWFGCARLRGVRTALVSIGAGPLAHPVSRYLARITGLLANYRSFRDEGSRAFMKEIGVNVQLDAAVHDIVFSLDFPKRNMDGNVDRPLVAVPVMSYKGWYEEDRSAEISNRHARIISDFCNWLLHEGYAVRLIVADGHDGPAADEVERSLRASAPELCRQWLSTGVARDIDALATLISDAVVVVASRYHSVIAGLMCAKPTISISYAEKNNELMRSVGLGSYCQHIEHVDLNRLRRQFVEIMDNCSQLSGELAIQVVDFRARLAAETLRMAQTLMPVPRKRARWQRGARDGRKVQR